MPDETKRRRRRRKSAEERPAAMPIGRFEPVSSTEPSPQPVTLSEPLATENLGVYVATLLDEYLPCIQGDETFKEIAKDYGGKGTTCGFLCHWLLWRIRYLNSTIVNRTESQDGLLYKPGMNIARIWNAGKPPFQRFQTGMCPEAGDIIFITNGPPLTEHVFVFLRTEEKADGCYWHSADGGQTDPSTGKQMMKFCERKQAGRTLVGKYGARGIAGYIPIRKLPLGPGACIIKSS